MTPDEAVRVINALGARVAELTVELEVVRARLATTEKQSEQEQEAADGDR